MESLKNYKSMRHFEFRLFDKDYEMIRKISEKENRSITLIVHHLLSLADPQDQIIQYHHNPTDKMSDRRQVDGYVDQKIYNEFVDISTKTLWPIAQIARFIIHVVLQTYKIRPAWVRPGRPKPLRKRYKAPLYETPYHQVSSVVGKDVKEWLIKKSNEYELSISRVVSMILFEAMNKEGGK